MGNSKKQKTAQKPQENVAKATLQASNLSVSELLRRIIEANQQITDTQTLVPCLYGESGVGKTQRVRQLAEAMGLPLKVVLLHSMLPEEVLGLPRVVDGQTVWSIPDWVDTQNPTIYLFDELDKVREEELGTILTLFADKKIRDANLPAGSVLIAGMQPIMPEVWRNSKTGQALIARMIFIPVKQSEALNYLQDKYKVDLSFVGETELTLPLIPPTTRQIDYALALRKKVEKPVWLQIIQGIFPQDFISVLVSNMSKSVFMEARELCEAFNEAGEGWESLDISQLIELGGPIFEYCKPKISAAIEEKILVEGTSEDWIRYHDKRYTYLEDKIKASPEGSIDVGGEATLEDYFTAYSSMLDRVIKKIKALQAKEKGQASAEQSQEQQ